MIKVVIIEDELNSQELLQSILEAHFVDIKVMGLADSVSTGISLIEKCAPDVVFLDIEIQGGTGFDILNAIEQPSFRVIFVTGYDHYALKAIKFSALDYILKPINIEELNIAIDKLGTSFKNQNTNLSFLKEQVAKPSEEIDQIILSDETGHNIIKFNDILYLKADGSYVTFFLQNEKKHLASNPLTFYESILPTSHFFRIHKSYLVNLKKVASVEPGRGGNIQITEGHVLPVAYRRKPRFLKKFKQA